MLSIWSRPKSDVWSKGLMYLHNVLHTEQDVTHSVFYSIKERNRHFSNTEFVVCKRFQFGQVQNW